MNILELPFWIFLILSSLLPGSKTLWFDIVSIPVNLTDIVSILVSCFYLILPKISDRPIIKFQNLWNYNLPTLTASLLLYASISVTWSGMNSRNTAAMLYTLLLTASGVFLGYNLIAKRDYKSIRKFMWQLTVFLAMLGVLYSAASLFALTPGDLRSEAYSGKSEFGILRVNGPLFAASTGYFVLVPALAFSIQEFIQSRNHRLFKLLVVFSLILTTIGLGSRGALVILGIFFALLIFSLKSKKQVIVAATVLILAVIIAAGIFFSQANPERLQSLEDTSRTQTYLISFQILAERTFEYNVPGSGYGSYWAWYITDVESFKDNIIINPETFFLSTKFGDILYNPHSTLLILIVELGLVGLLFFLFLWSVLVRLLFHSNQKTSSSAILACGIFSSGLSMFFDCFFFKYNALSAIWVIFLFGALVLKLNSHKFN